MTNTNVVAPVKRATWIAWMHVAGVGYAVALPFLFGALVVLEQGLAYVGLFALVVATFAFVGGWGRFLATKR